MSHYALYDDQDLQHYMASQGHYELTSLVLVFQMEASLLFFEKYEIVLFP